MADKAPLNAVAREALEGMKATRGSTVPRFPESARAFLIAAGKVTGGLHLVARQKSKGNPLRVVPMIMAAWTELGILADTLLYTVPAEDFDLGQLGSLDVDRGLVQVKQHLCHLAMILDAFCQGQAAEMLRALRQDSFEVDLKLAALIKSITDEFRQAQEMRAYPPHPQAQEESLRRARAFVIIRALVLSLELHT